ncbi:DUF3310 domain-containing protein [Selenomonas sp. AE3005]|uniref:DUF3310 domain-containing protein n=1 Tax=Selenomonas sp. AE3005 TaxID=1485543 RepID=UPI00068C09DB|nr:DUF3310 domain-containing protein [Selenomonas sp. AE3005]
MKYKAGDKVRIRKDIKLDEDYNGIIVTMSMLRHVGEVCTIQGTGCDGCYYFKENIYAWAEDMIEGLANDAPDITKLTIADAIKPNYYQYREGDVFDMAAHFQLNFPLGNALKYLLRAGHKDPARKIEDLRKCIQCIQRAIEIEGEKYE